MARRALLACALALVLAAPGLAGAGEVRLSIQNGRVALVAHDATLREILLEWERVGGTRIVNRDRVPATRLNLELPNVTEEQALNTLLRPIAGYMASRRLGPEGGASGFSRIVLMPGEATPLGYTPLTPVQTAGPPSQTMQPGMGGPPFGRPGMQRRVLPDGRVVTVLDDQAQQADEPDEAGQANQPGMMRPPFNAPPRGMQDQPAGNAPQPDIQPGQVVPTLKTSPGIPTTAPVPGALPPAKTPQTPPKPPGD